MARVHVTPSNLQPFLSPPTGPVWALPLQCQLPLSQYNEFPLCQAVPASQPKEWNKYRSHWQVSGAGRQGPRKGGMKKEAETAADLAGVGYTGWGSWESRDLCTHAQEGWASVWGKWLSVARKKRKGS